VVVAPALGMPQGQALLDDRGMRIAEGLDGARRLPDREEGVLRIVRMRVGDPLHAGMGAFGAAVAESEGTSRLTRAPCLGARGGEKRRAPGAPLRLHATIQPVPPPIALPKEVFEPPATLRLRLGRSALHRQPSAVLVGGGAREMAMRRLGAVAIARRQGGREARPPRVDAGRHRPRLLQQGIRGDAR